MQDPCRGRGMVLALVPGIVPRTRGWGVIVHGGEQSSVKSYWVVALGTWNVPAGINSWFGGSDAVRSVSGGRRDELSGDAF